jgi:hypothetical protein
MGLGSFGIPLYRGRRRAWAATDTGCDSGDDSGIVGAITIGNNNSLLEVPTSRERGRAWLSVGTPPTGRRGSDHDSPASACRFYSIVKEPRRGGRLIGEEPRAQMASVYRT